MSTHDFFIHLGSAIGAGIGTLAGMLRFFHHLRELRRVDSGQEQRLRLVEERLRRLEAKGN